jgi:hypothetical protein
MIRSAQAMAQAEPVSAAIFALTAFVLVLFAGKVFLSASAHPDSLLTLRVSVGGLALFAAVGLAYETMALATGRIPSISELIDRAFNANPLAGVVIFSGIMLLIGLGAIHLTRVVSPSSGAVRWWVLVAGGVAYAVGGIIAGAVASRP